LFITDFKLGEIFTSVEGGNAKHTIFVFVNISMNEIVLFRNQHAINKAPLRQFYLPKKITFNREAKNSSGTSIINQIWPVLGILVE